MTLAHETFGPEPHAKFFRVCKQNWKTLKLVLHLPLDWSSLKRCDMFNFCRNVWITLNMASAGLYRIYVGNLEESVSEEILEKLFQEHDLFPSNILVKRGYAFVDLPHSDSFNQAITSLNGTVNFVLPVMYECKLPCKCTRTYSYRRYVPAFRSFRSEQLP